MTFCSENNAHWQALLFYSMFFQSGIANVRSYEINFPYYLTALIVRWL